MQTPESQEMRSCGPSPWLLAHLEGFVCKAQAYKPTLAGLVHMHLVVVHPPGAGSGMVPLDRPHIIVVRPLPSVAHSQLVLVNLHTL